MQRKKTCILRLYEYCIQHVPAVLMSIKIISGVFDQYLYYRLHNSYLRSCTYTCR